MSGKPEELGYETDLWETARSAQPEPFRHLFVDVLSDKDATVARVAATITTPDGTSSFEATGSSRRDRGDAYNQFTGDTLAIARALVKLGQKLEKQAQSRINAAAAIKAHHEEIAARKAQEQAEEIAGLTYPTYECWGPGDVSQSGSGGTGGIGSSNTIHYGGGGGRRPQPGRMTFTVPDGNVADGNVAGGWWPGGGGGASTRFPSIPVETTPVEAPSPVFVEIPIPFGRKVRVSKLGEVQVLNPDGEEIRSYYA